MSTVVSVRQQLTKAINELPAEVLPELVNFIEYLQFKTNPSVLPAAVEKQSQPGSSFLLSIADLGASAEDDLSERDEEILAAEIDPLRGWGLKDETSPIF